jgi:tetrahydromethanopterin S-methyltransferase subunit D
MWRVKMFGKFIIWLLKKVFKVPLMAIVHVHLFIDYWKKQCRRDWGMATLLFILTSACCTVSSLFGILIFVAEANITREMLGEATIRGFLFAVGVFIVVMLLASYEAFKEEYEQSFTKLKE